MGRLPNWRRVSFLPNANYFKPAGVPPQVLQEVCLSIEEAEAIRLKDYEGLDQDHCALSMRVSRPTFARILGSARRKIADAMLNGKALRISGGDFQMATSRFRCIEGHEWDVPFDAMIARPPEVCPECRTLSIMPIYPRGFGRGGGGGGRRHRYGRRW